MDPNELDGSVPEDNELVQILEQMLRLDESITARAVARKHSSIHQPSSFTRNPRRRGTIDTYKKRQAEIRSFPGYGHNKRSRGRLASDLAERDARIVELEKQVEVLKVGFVAMMRAVGELGGISRWLRLFEGYREIVKELGKLDVLPEVEVRDIENGNRK